VLLFLPGAEEIRRASARLEPWSRRAGFDVLPLHGSMPEADQDRALRPSNRRKVILATNIAETSLTIDGVKTVIDSGLARVASDDPRAGSTRWSCDGSAGRRPRNARAARAGRRRGAASGSGRNASSEEWPSLTRPRWRRLDLASTVLALHAWGASDPSQFGWFEPPAA